MLASGAQVLGYVVPPPPEGYDTWDDVDPARSRPSSGARRSPASTPRVWARGCSSSAFPKPRPVKNRLHVDVRAGTGLVGDERVAALEAECARLVALGAVRVRLLPADDDNESCLVMQDVRGQ